MRAANEVRNPGHRVKEFWFRSMDSGVIHFPGIFQASGSASPWAASLVRLITGPV